MHDPRQVSKLKGLSNPWHEVRLLENVIARLALSGLETQHAVSVHARS